MRKLLLFTFVFCLVVSAKARADEAALRYAITEIASARDDKPHYIWVRAINNHGEVVGLFDSHAFIWRKGKLSLIEQPPKSTACGANDINDTGQIVGTCSFGSPTLSYFLWKNGKIQNLRLQGQPAGNTFINNSGEVVTNVHRPISKLIVDMQIVFWKDGHQKNYGDGWLWGFSDNGQIVGTQMLFSNDPRRFITDWAAIWEHGHPANLAGGRTRALAINNNRDIVIGRSFNSSTLEYELYLLKNNRRIELGKFGNLEVLVYKMNNMNQIIGDSISIESGRPVMWQDNQWHDLNDLIPLNSGWFLENAIDINENGQIIGSGKLNGKTRAFLLTPISQTPKP